MQKLSSAQFTGDTYLPKPSVLQGQSHAKQKTFVDEAKRFYTDLINLLVKDEKEKRHVFDKDGLYLATKKIGKNNPKAE